MRYLQPTPCLWFWCSAAALLSALAVGPVASRSGPPPTEQMVRTQALSAAGRFLAFETRANALTPGDTNRTSDVFVWDRVSGAIDLVSVSLWGGTGDGWSGEPAISGDGRYVAFTSAAENLVSGDRNRKLDVFVRDRLRRATELLSVGSTGAPGDGSSREPAISADGRTVAFASSAKTLVRNDPTRWAGIFLRDLELGTIERVSVETAAEQTTGGHCYDPSVSADGDCVAFASFAYDLLTGKNARPSQVYLRSRSAKTTDLISVSPDGKPGDGDSSSPVLSGDSRYVAFSSKAANLVAGDADGLPDVFLRDRSTRTTKLASAVDGGHDCLGLSANGGWVLLSTWTSPTREKLQDDSVRVVLYERATSKLDLVPIGPGGRSWRRPSITAAISGDGQVIAGGASVDVYEADRSRNHGTILVHERMSGKMTSLPLRSR